MGGSTINLQVTFQYQELSLLLLLKLNIEDLATSFIWKVKKKNSNIIAEFQL